MKPYLKWLFLGLLLRLLIIPFTGHWDVVALHYPGSLVFSLKDGIYNVFYTTYPPLTYLFFGIWQKIIDPFTFGNLTAWLNGPVISSFRSPEAFRYFFLLKILYLPFDLATGFLLTKLVSDEKKKIQIFRLWILNPIVIYLVYMWSSIDIIPTMFLILSTYLLLKNRLNLATFVLGLGSAFKIFPILLIPVFIALKAKSTKEKMISALIGILPLAVTTLPFLKNPSFIKNVFFNPSSQSLLYARIPIGAYQDMLLFVVLWVILIIYLLTRTVKENQIKLFIFAPLLLFYILSAFSPQWFLWGLPFFLIYYVEIPSSQTLTKSLFLLYAIIILLSDNSLNFALFAPLQTSLLMMPPIGEIINGIFNLNSLLSLIRSVFSGIAIYLAFHLMTKEYAK